MTACRACRGTTAIALTDFLLARIAEDHAVAFAASTDTYGSAQWTCEPWLCDEQASHVAVDPPRMLAECEAKRLIVEEVRETLSGKYGHATRRILELLALPYADHPDYSEEWKP